MSAYDQQDFAVRFDWGPEGARELARLSRAVIVVDVLSFSTAVEVAIARGARIRPIAWDPAVSTDVIGVGRAIAAVPRSRMSPQHPFSLSPPSMANARRGMTIVVASPNGARVALEAQEAGAAMVIAGCLRNAAAVAAEAARTGGPISVIAAGEKWSVSGTLRPAFEDLAGAGAIIAELGALTRSPEARAAEAAFRASRARLRAMLLACASGRELVERGFGADVIWSAELNVSRAVPALRAGAFVDAHGGRGGSPLGSAAGKSRAGRQ
jgi:2-phosphosulfolactate phosphatase